MKVVFDESVFDESGVDELVLYRWDMKSEVIAGICTEFTEPVFEAVVNLV